MNLDLRRAIDGRGAHDAEINPPCIGRTVMVRTITTTAFAALFVLAGSAGAQEFKGDCKPFADKAACDTSGWCRWTDRKPVTLPTGQQFQPKGFCGFRPGFKAGWTETVKPAAAATPKQ